MKRTPAFFKNKYVLTTLLFVAWMVFFDNNSIPRQYKIYKDRKQLQATVDDTRKMLENLKRSRGMLGSIEGMERFAREEYRFKKKNEEIFVIVMKEEE